MCHNKDQLRASDIMHNNNNNSLIIGQRRQVVKCLFECQALSPSWLSDRSSGFGFLVEKTLLSCSLCIVLSFSHTHTHTNRQSLKMLKSNYCVALQSF